MVQKVIRVQLGETVQLQHFTAGQIILPGRQD